MRLALFPVLLALLVGCLKAKDSQSTVPDAFVPPVSDKSTKPDTPDTPNPLVASYRKASVLNLRQIGLATRNYTDTYLSTPTNGYGFPTRSDKVLLSWRVMLLPFIEQGDLFRLFDLNQPWNSPGNKRLIPKMPKIYKPVRGSAKTGETYYRGFTGPDAYFAGNRGYTQENLGNGGNILMVVEAAEPVIWTKPDDLPFDTSKPLPKLGGEFDGDFHVLMADGSVRWVKKNFNPEALKDAIVVIGDKKLAGELGKIVKPTN